MSDGGMQWWAERGMREQDERAADEDARLIEAHRKWKREFLSGLPTTNEKKQDSEKTHTTEVQ